VFLNSFGYENLISGPLIVRTSSKTVEIGFFSDHTYNLGLVDFGCPTDLGKFCQFLTSGILAASGWVKPDFGAIVNNVRPRKSAPQG